MANLKITPRGHGNARGKDVFEQILRAAFNVLVENGSSSLTLGRIAEECGMKTGNISYYFATKEDLLHELIEAIVNNYLDITNKIVGDQRYTSSQHLLQFISLVLDDLKTKETTHIFPDLWAQANHDPFVKDRVEDIFRRSRAALITMLADINPDLPEDERETLALFMQASLEGLTVFAGYGKEGVDRMEWFKRLAEMSFLHLARNIKPGEMRNALDLPKNERRSVSPG